MDAAELEEFLAAAAVEAPPAAEAAAAAEELQQLVELQPDPDDEGQELPELLALAAVAPGRRVFEQRSGELMTHARRKLDTRRAERRLETERCKRAKVSMQLAVVAVSDRTFAGTIGLKANSMCTPDVKGVLMVKLASLPRVRSALHGKQRKQQTRALTVVAKVLQSGRDACWQGLTSLRDRPGPSASDRVLMFACQWDETSQRFRQVRSTAIVNGQRLMRSRLASQVMVFSGSMVDLGITHDSLNIQPYFCSTLVVKETHANALMDSAFRNLPFDIESYEEMTKLSACADAFILALTLDRASANLLSAKVIALLCTKLPCLILPWCELCAAHGVALVKTKAAMVKSLSAALCSFTLWTKVSRNIEVLEAELSDQIALNFEIRRSHCPEEFAETGERLITAIWGGKDSSALWRWDAKLGCNVETPLQGDLKAMCRVCTFGKGGGPVWVHFCYVTAGSPENIAGRPVGSRCCSSTKEAVNKVAVLVKNLCTGRAWAEAKMARWTNVGSANRRFVFLSAAGDILIKSLRGVKTHWGLEANLEASLARQVNADRNDFSSRNKLRLLRIVKALALPDTLTNLAVCLITFGVMDEFLFAVLGGPQRPRVSLSALVHPVTSPIVKAQTDLARLLFNFGPADVGAGQQPSWLAYELLCGAWDHPEKRLEARRCILQLSAATLDLFEMRMEKAPYRLLWLTHDDDVVPAGAKAEVVGSFFQAPEACLPLLCLRLKEMHPTIERFKVGAVAPLRTLGLGTCVSVDFSERAHSQFRHDVASPTSGADFEACSNRLLLRQFIAAHVVAGGTDPASKTASDIAVEAGLAPADKPRTRACTTYVVFSNSRRMAIKQLVAPNRKMSRAEVAAMEANIKEQWGRVKHDPLQMASWRAKAESSQLVAREGGEQGIAAIARPFVSPCNLSKDPRFLIDRDVMAVAAGPKRPGPCLADHDPVPPPGNMCAGGSAPDRKAMVKKGDRDWMFGCYQNKLNVCRSHAIPQEFGDRLDNMVRMMSHWVGSLPTEQRASAAQLVGFVGSGAGSGDGESTIIVIELLVLHRGSPKMQFWADCRLSTSELRPAQHPLAFPCDVEIMGRDARLAVPGGGRRAIAISTSDEVGKYLLDLRGHWVMRLLTYDINTADPGLHKMTIKSEEEVGLGCARAPRARPVAAHQLPAEFFMGDPLDFGKSQASASSAPAFTMSPFASRGGDAPADDADASASSDDADDASLFGLDGLGPEEQEDIEELMAMGRELPAPVYEPEVADEADLPEVDFADVELVAAEPEREGVAAADGHPLPAEASADELRAEARRQASLFADAAAIDLEGKVTCSAEPFNWYNLVGKITVYPKNVPADKQNVAINCRLHHGCSHTRRRHRFTDRQLVEWLFHGRPYVPGGLSGEALAAQHKIDAIRLL